MKKKKLNLTELKVQSFITGIEKETIQTVRGGRDTIICSLEHSRCMDCIPETEGCILSLQLDQCMS